MPANPPGRVYHAVTVEAAGSSRWTHVCAEGSVTYVRKQQDGDWHITIEGATGAKLVLEIIPLIPLAPPRKHETVRACGIARQDTDHGWPEIHPVETLTVTKPRRER